MTVMPYSEGGVSGIRFISTADDGPESEEAIEGNPTDPQGTLLFQEGNSGRQKMAVLSASISQTKVSIRIVRRRRLFIVSTPFEVSLKERA
jgi:hypothetical protein